VGARERPHKCTKGNRSTGLSPFHLARRVKDAFWFPVRLTGQLRGRPLIGPYAAHVDIIWPCNLRCIGCWVHSSYRPEPAVMPYECDRMPYDLFCQLVEDLARLHTSVILLSGAGEPAMHECFEDMLCKINKEGMLIALISNMLLLKPDNVASCHFDRILANLWSASDPTYRRNHPGCPVGAFDRVREMIAYLTARGVSIDCVQVINKTNYHEIPEMIVLARQLGAGVAFRTLQVEEEERVWKEPFALGPEERSDILTDLIPQAKRLAARYKVRENLDKLALELQPHGHGIIRDMGCYMGAFFTRVKLNGHVYFCCGDLPQGSAASSLFRDVWFGTSYQRLRKRLREKRYPRVCRTCPNYNQNYQLAAFMRPVWRRCCSKHILRDRTGSSAVAQSTREVDVTRP